MRSFLVPWLLALAAADSAQTGPSFESIAVQLGGGANELLVHDWNGDGVFDLFATHPIENRVSVTAGRGDGTFESPSFDTVNGVTSAILGDVNGDGIIDACVIERDGSASRIVTFLFDATGGMTRSTSVWLNSGIERGERIALMDVDADGNQDLVAIVFVVGSATNPPDGYLTTLIGNGAGSFAPSGLSRSVGSFPRDIELADFDADGRLDAAVANNGSNDVTICFGDTLGTFASSVTEPAIVQAVSLAVADLDQDGRLDVVVGSSISPTVALLRNQGAGAFQRTLQPTQGATATVAAGDFDGDGSPDVATASGGPVVLLNDGSGAFGTPIASYLPGTASLVVADVDADGRNDLVAGHNTEGATVVLGDGTGHFADHERFDGSFLWCEAFDLDRDGHDDLVYQRNDVIGQSGVSVRLASGDGTFGPSVQFSTTHTSRHVAFGDWTGDGIIDIASVNTHIPSLPIFPTEQTISVHAGDGAGNFTQVGERVLAEPAIDLDLVDLENNGVLEVLLIQGNGVSFVFQRSAMGGLEPGQIVPLTLANRFVAADFTGDGAIDVVTVQGQAWLHVNDGTGGFLAPVLVDAGGNASRLEARDLDGDGHLDLVAWNASALLAMRNTGASFEPPVASVLPSPQFPFHVPDADFGDVNGDGRIDVVIDGPTAKLLLGRVDLTWAPRQGLRGSAGDVVLGQFDGDGFPDLAVTSIDLVVHPNRALASTGVRAFGMGTPGCLGTHLALTNRSPDMGVTDFAYTCNRAPANSIGLIAGSQNAIEAGAPVLGLLAHVNPAGPLFVLDLVVSDADGIARFPVMLPSDLALAGATYTRQFVWDWPLGGCSPSPLGWSTSRGVEVTLQ